MSGALTLEQRIALATQSLRQRRQSLAWHRSQLQLRVLAELRASPLTVVAGAALLVWVWCRRHTHRRP